MADKNFGLVTVENVDRNSRGSRVLQDKTTEEDEPKNIFDRYINLVAIINFGFTLQAGWESVGLLLSMALLNGGPVSLVYGAVLSGVGSSCVALSLGEMASMDPTVGAQYRWSARFAPKWPEFFGLIQGWITVFAWIANVSSALVLLSNTTQGIIGFHYPGYTSERWHATLMMWAFIIFSIVCNLFLRKILNGLETLGGICHVVFFVVIITIMTTLGRRSDPSWVFKTLVKDASGWGNAGICFNLGVLLNVYPITSSDGVLHMIDETKEPRKRVPYSMWMSTVLNATLLFAYVIALLFCIGDFERVSKADLPILEVYYLATQSKAIATTMVLMQLSIIAVSLFNCFASVSRLVWAFARDKGLPFHQAFTYVHPKLQIPLPALFLVAGVSCILALINIGSEVAFNALISLSITALHLSYVIPIFLLTLRKLRGQHPRYGPFRLGRLGLPINFVALSFNIYCLIWTPFPPMYPVTSSNMNYAGPITLGVVSLALLDWFTAGRKRFEVPTGQFNVEMEDYIENKRD